MSSLLEIVFFFQDDLYQIRTNKYYTYQIIMITECFFTRLRNNIESVVYHPPVEIWSHMQDVVPSTRVNH